LASHDFIALLESAFALAIFAGFLLVLGASPHDALSINHGFIHGSRMAAKTKSQCSKASVAKCLIYW
jgi:hypothetical protein